MGEVDNRASLCEVYVYVYGACRGGAVLVEYSMFYGMRGHSVANGRPVRHVKKARMVKWMSHVNTTRTNLEPKSSFQFILASFALTFFHIHVPLVCPISRMVVLLDLATHVSASRPPRPRLA